MFCAPAAAADATVKVTVAGVPGRMVAGCTVAVTPADALTAKVTALLAEPLSVTLTANVAVLPG